MCRPQCSDIEHLVLGDEQIDTRAALSQAGDDLPGHRIDARRLGRRQAL
jgi:hypothetical protein